jgi:acetyl esterase
MTRPIDPQVAAQVSAAQRRGRLPFERQTPAQARAAYRDGCALTGPMAVPMASIADVALGSVACRVYRPIDAALLPAILFAHGGGWVVGDLESHDGICRKLAADTRCAVVAVDYRLAPEHPFPTPFNDVLQAWTGLVAEATPLGLDPRRLGVAGDSAGAALVASLSQACRDDPALAPRFQLLFYPATDLGASSASYAQITKDVFLTAATMHWFRGHYAPEPSTWSDWRASPLCAVDLAALPPALVLTVGHDPLRDEGVAYAGRLAQEGNEVTHIHLPDQIHGLLTQGRLMPASDAVWSEAAAFVRKHVS